MDDTDPTTGSTRGESSLCSRGVVEEETEESFSESKRAIEAIAMKITSELEIEVVTLLEPV